MAFLFKPNLPWRPKKLWFVALHSYSKFDHKLSASNEKGLLIQHIYIHVFPLSSSSPKCTACQEGIIKDKVFLCL